MQHRRVVFAPPPLLLEDFGTASNPPQGVPLLRHRLDTRWPPPPKTAIERGKERGIPSFRGKKTCRIRTNEATEAISLVLSDIFFSHMNC